MNEVMNAAQVVSDNIPPANVPIEEPRFQSQLGKLLQEARERQGLELSDVASATHVRKEYLSALDEGRYNDLPENVYTRNFLRLYAQTVGLEEKPILELYSQERYGVLISETKTKKRKPDKLREQESNSTRTKLIVGNNTRLWAIVLSLAVSVVLLLLVWRTFMLPDGKGGWLFSLPWVQAPVTSLAPESNSDFVEEPLTAEAFAVPSSENSNENSSEAQNIAAVSDFVTFSLITVPEGARVSLDNYDLGFTPIYEAPLTPAKQKVLKISLDGYEPIEKPIELDQSVNLSYALLEAGTTPEESDPVTSAFEAEQVNQDSIITNNVIEDTDNETPASTSESTSTGKITIDVEEVSWLEVYTGTVRGEGSRLVYRMTEPGESFTFDLPVYVRSGNSSAVHISINNQDRGYLSDGTSGAVLGQAFE